MIGFLISRGKILHSQAVTKKEAIRLLENALGIKGASPILYEYVKNAGVDISFDTNANLSRGQVSSIVAKAFDLKKDLTQINNAKNIRFLQLVQNAIRNQSPSQQIASINLLISRLGQANPTILKKYGLDVNLLIKGLQKSLDQSWVKR